MPSTVCASPAPPSLHCDGPVSPMTDIDRCRSRTFDVGGLHGCVHRASRIPLLAQPQEVNMAACPVVTPATVTQVRSGEEVRLRRALGGRVLVDLERCRPMVEPHNLGITGWIGRRVACCLGQRLVVPTMVARPRNGATATALAPFVRDLITMWWIQPDP